ncbi:MAG: zinc-dependent metalloprotease, partial [Planctomycetota bacterium]|nr:zinc-dependent metalloprotease [Planctomycetota bacterium]
SVAGGTNYTGFQWSDALLYWKVQGDKLLLIEKNTQFRGKKGTPIGESVNRTYTDTLVLTMPVATKSTRGGYLIDMNKLFASNASKFFGSAGRSLDSSLAVFTKLKVFPMNTEIAVTMPERGGGSFVTLHYSMRDLGRSTYKPREADDRIGYFMTVAKDFNKGPKDDGRFVRYINRWNLEKLDPKLELSPVKEPIVFYLEQTIPVPYRRYVAAGILEWNKAFEKVGFLNAVQVRQQTATNEFKDFDPEDARYNFFRWITSEEAFAMGPSRVNPLTGEILDADIIFDDSMINWAVMDYERIFVKQSGDKKQALLDLLLNGQKRPRPFGDLELPLNSNGKKVSAFDKAVVEEIRKRAKGPQKHVCYFGHQKRHELSMASLMAASGGKLPLEFIGQSIKETVMHEVGHTMGLRHNFVASTYLPLAKINSKDKPAAISGSVMDYHPMNVATPKQEQGQYLSDSIGPYDFWAIEYGYTLKGDAKSLKVITDQVAKSGLAFATDEDTWGPDPYVNRWDMGKNPLNFSKSRVAIAQHLLKDLEKRAMKPGQGFRRLRGAFGGMLYEYSTAGNLAARFIGGVRIHRDHFGDPNGRDPIEPVAAAQQRAALKFLEDEIFSGKNFQFDGKLLARLGSSHWSHWGSRGGSSAYPIHDRILSIQKRALNSILASDTLQRVIDTEYNVDEKVDVLTLPDLFGSLSKSMFTELANAPVGATARKAHINSIRRNLQREYVKQLIDRAIELDGGTPQAAKTLAWYHLKGLRKAIDTYVKANEAKLDPYSLSHLDEISTRIEKALEAAYQLGGNNSGGGGFFFLFGKTKAEALKALKAAEREQQKRQR